MWVLWWSRTVHLSDDGASVPSSASVAEPRSVIVWPTRKRREASGDPIEGAGAVLPASIRTVAVSVAPVWSVTRSVAR